MGKQVHRNGRDLRRGWSLATTTADRSRAVPRETLVAETLVHGGDRLGLVRAEELKRRRK